MSRSRHISDHFDANVRQRGDAYARQGRVTLLDGGQEAIESVVTGGRPYYVLIARSGQAISLRCSCPYVRDRRSACKHIWATLNVARNKGRAVPYRAHRVHIGWNDGSVPDHVIEAIEASSDTSRLAGRDGQEHWTNLVSSAVGYDDPRGGRSPTGITADEEILYLVDVQGSSRTRGLIIELVRRRRTSSEDGEQPKSYLLESSEIPSLPDEHDRLALALIDGAREAAPPSYRFHSPDATDRPRPSSRHGVPFLLAGTLLPLICGTGRCHLRSSSNEATIPLRWDESSWELWLEVTRADRDAKRTVYTLGGSLRRGTERLALETPTLLTAGGLVFHEDRVSPLNDFGAFGWIALLQREGTITVPEKDGDDLLLRILEAPHHPKLDLPDALSIDEVRTPPLPRLLIRARSKGTRNSGWLTAELSFEYDDQIVVPGTGGDVVQLDRRRVLLRNPEAERRAVERLLRLPLRPIYRGNDREHDGAAYRLRSGDLAEVVRHLLDDEWFVEVSGDRLRPPGSFRLEVSSGIDWFELRSHADFGDQAASVPELLAALDRGDDTVTLGDGSRGLLPEDWRDKIARFLAMGTLADDHVRFGRSQVALLDALLDALPDATVDAGFARARSRMADVDKIQPVDPPRSFVGTLRDYQRDGLGWMRWLGELGLGGCLADDMGLGKTVQVLALLDSRRRKPRGRDAKPSLVVVPRSLIFNWKSEAARFTPRLELVAHTGAERATTADLLRGNHVILTTYGTLRRDITLLTELDFDYVILDEAQAIKNAGTASAKSARLLKGDHRLALSGTPIENHVGELWSLFEFLNPGLLGTAAAFRSLRDATGDLGVKERELVSRGLRPLILRRTKAQVASELPPKIEQSLYCELPATQRKLYDDLRAHYRTSLDSRIAVHGLQKSKILVLEALLRLRQAACHPGLIDADMIGEPSAKLDLLIDQLDEVADEGHKALVFSQFTSLLAILRTHLDRGNVSYAYLDGRTRNRAQEVERFQTDPDCKLFLISLKAGGLGLNLTAAEYVYLLDPWWNPAVEAQAIDRAHRIGQTQQVFAYRLIAKDTVEEKIVELQQAKSELADSIIKADDGLIRNLGREDLELLLS